MIDVRQLVTVAEITTNVRSLAVEVELEGPGTGLDEPSVVNCDGIHTIEQALLTGPIGGVREEIMSEVCSALTYALGC